MKMLLLAGTFATVLAAGAQEKTEVIKPQGIEQSRPAVKFRKDPQQSRMEPTTQIVTNTAKGNAPRSQTDTGGAVSVDKDLSQRVRVALSTGSVGTQGILATDQLTDIKVTATNRMVTLRGEVISQENKEIIGKRVAGLDGVKGVNNQLTVNPHSKPRRANLFKPDGYSPGNKEPGGVEKKENE